MYNYGVIRQMRRCDIEKMNKMYKCIRDFSFLTR